MQLSDKILREFDSALRTLFPPASRQGKRPVPGQNLPEANLTMAEKKHIVGMMRVNHSGEVCAQALYQGQALTAKLPGVKEKMHQAALEETEHLAWCEQRLRELDSRPSFTNFIWYTGSLVLGAVAGLAGDRYSLGFVAETERQVTEHLEKHLQSLPDKDERTRAVLKSMQEDETAHAEMALAAGAASLPAVIRQMMRKTATLMTGTTYYF